MKGELGTVYLVHFQTRLAHAGHYVGWASDFVARIQEHRAGQGARLLAALVAERIPFEVVRVWPNQTRSFERRLHRRKQSPQLCPVCNPNVNLRDDYGQHAARGCGDVASHWTGAGTAPLPA